MTDEIGRVPDEMTPEEQIKERRDPSNYEFGETEYGLKIHIVATGLPVSMLVRGGRASGDYGEGERKALCGHVADFETGVDPPTTIDGALDEICTRCRHQASPRIANKGKFEEVPL